MTLGAEGSGGLGGGESVDGVNGAGEQHGVATLARLQAEGCDQMGLAEPDAADEHDVGGVVEEAQAEEVLDLEAVDVLGPGPIEGIEGFLHGESGESDAPFDGAVASQVGLALDESFEHGEVVGLLFGGTSHDVGVVLADEGELEDVEMGVEGIEVVRGLTGRLRKGAKYYDKRICRPVRSPGTRFCAPNCGLCRRRARSPAAVPAAQRDLPALLAQSRIWFATTANPPLEPKSTQSCAPFQASGRLP